MGSKGQQANELMSHTDLLDEIQINVEALINLLAMKDADVSADFQSVGKHPMNTTGPREGFGT